MKLADILKTLGWPLGLTLVFTAILGLFGLTLEQLEVIATGMLGAQAIIALLIDVLKYIGVLSDGYAGIVNAALHGLGIVAIAVGLVLKPDFDFPALDAQLEIIAKFGSLVLLFIVQSIGAKKVHELFAHKFKIKAFSFSAA